MTLVLTTVSVVMRSGRAAWDAHEGDYTRLASAHATVRHIVRAARQADAVIAISDPASNSGSLTLQTPEGDLLVWQHNATDRTVQFGPSVANNLLADNIHQLSFQGFRADGVTPTTSVDEMQCVRVAVTVQLPRDGAPTRTVSSWVWIRSW
jgi:hypothetical protein